MNPEQASRNLAVIRELMERPVKVTTQSGLAGILAGVVTLAGSTVDFCCSARCDNDTSLLCSFLTWSGVFVISMLGALDLTRLRERRQGMPFWTPAKRKVIATILPPFLAAAGLTLAVAMRYFSDWGQDELWLLPGVWMLFYGIACWQVGAMTIPEIRVMGCAFLLAGILTVMFFQQDIPGLPRGTAPYWTMAATFGLFHIVYGVVVWIRHGG